MRLKDVTCYIKRFIVLNDVFLHVRQNYTTFKLEAKKILQTLCGKRKSINEVLICTD